MTVQSYRYLGPKQQQVLWDLSEGWVLTGSFGVPYRLHKVHPGGAIEVGYALHRPLVIGLEARGLIRPKGTAAIDINQWVLTVRGTLAVTKMKRGRG